MDAATTGNHHRTGAVILAGGLGTRLRSVVADRPKVLAEVCGRPFIHFLIDQVARAGFREVLLCTGFRADQLAQSLGTSACGVRLRYSAEPEPLGTAGALRHALPLLRAREWLVLNGDSYCDVDLFDFQWFHREQRAAASLVLARVDDASRFGRVETDTFGAITAFLEKSPISGPAWINAGVYLLARDLIERVPAAKAVSLERECFPAWIGANAFGYPCNGRFLDIGTPTSYRQAESFFASLPADDSDIPPAHLNAA